MGVYFSDPLFLLYVLVGAVAGLFVGAIPGLSVTTAAALIVSISYSWSAEYAVAAIMGVYVVGVFSGAVSAILLNIPGAPSAIATGFDGYPLARMGRARDAIRYAAIYSFVGSVFGFIVLWLVRKPVSAIALGFHPMDYFLLGLFGLTAVSLLSGKAPLKGFIAAVAGIVLSMVGLDPVLGTPRLTFGIRALQGGIGVVPVLIGIFGFSEILWSVFSNDHEEAAGIGDVKPEKLTRTLRFIPRSLYYCTIGALIGALPGTGSPIAALVAYGEAKRTVKNPTAAFGEGAIEGIVASESANNACIGGALIPMLTLAVPGDAVTAVMLSVFTIHGLRPGPLFLSENPQMFSAIMASGIVGCVCLLLLGLFAAPRLSRVLTVPRRFLLPAVGLLCAAGAFAYNNRIFDVFVMLFSGALGFVMRKRGFPAAPLILGLVLGGMMDTNFRRAVSLAAADANPLASLFMRPVTILLIAVIALTLFMRTAIFKKAAAAVSNRIHGGKRNG